jgi:hypothetical protein
MSLLSSFAAILVATNTPAPHPRLEGAQLAGQLAKAKTPRVAERACAVHWEPESDGWWSCFVGLESWRCEIQGWCDDAGRVVEAMPLPDPAWAGRIDWDAI